MLYANIIPFFLIKKDHTVCSLPGYIYPPTYPETYRELYTSFICSTNWQNGYRPSMMRDWTNVVGTMLGKGGEINNMQEVESRLLGV